MLCGMRLRRKCCPVQKGCKFYENIWSVRTIFKYIVRNNNMQRCSLEQQFAKNMLSATIICICKKEIAENDPIWDTPKLIPNNLQNLKNDPRRQFANSCPEQQFLKRCLERQCAKNDSSRQFPKNTYQEDKCGTRVVYFVLRWLNLRWNYDWFQVTDLGKVRSLFGLNRHWTN